MLRRVFGAIPWFLRVTALTASLFTTVLVILLGALRATQADPVCLVIESDVRHTVDPRTGADYLDYREQRETQRLLAQASANPPARPSEYFAYDYSPDGW